MTEMKMVALYDFYTVVEGELSFQARDILTIITEDIGEGWWEARNANGLTGLVPISYFMNMEDFRLLQSESKSSSLQNSPQKQRVLSDRSADASSKQSAAASIVLKADVHCDVNGMSKLQGQRKKHDSPMSKPKLPPKPSVLPPKPMVNQSVVSATPPADRQMDKEPERKTSGIRPGSDRKVATKPPVDASVANSDSGTVEDFHAKLAEVLSASLNHEGTAGEASPKCTPTSSPCSSPWKAGRVPPPLPMRPSQPPMLPWKPPNLLSTMSEQFTSATLPLVLTHTIGGTVASGGTLPATGRPPEPPSKPCGLTEWLRIRQESLDDANDGLPAEDWDAYMNDDVDKDDDDFDDGDDGEFFNSSTRTKSKKQRHTERRGSDSLSNDGDGTSESSMSDLSNVPSFSRSAHFTRAGDSYLFDMQLAPLPDTVQRIGIESASVGLRWVGVFQSYHCTICSPRKETKFHGMKSFIVYQLTPSFSAVTVSRRYKHFDWLQQRLLEKFTTVAIPALPEKQIAGRFDSAFICRRLSRLQSWMERMCRHPVISQSEVFLHFLTCTDVKMWKNGKRKAEKDKYLGGLFFLTLITPHTLFDTRLVELQLDSFGRYIKNFDDSVRQLYAASEDNRKKHSDTFKKEFQKLSSSFLALSKAFEQDDRRVARPVTNAISYAGRSLEDVGHMFEEQPKHDLRPMMEGLTEYKGLLSVLPDIILVHQASTNKVQENAGRFSESEIEIIQKRVDVITYSVLAEMNHFQEQRVVDFKQYMQRYLTSQIAFYKQVTAKFRDALKQFEDIK